MRKHDGKLPLFCTERYKRKYVTIYVNFNIYVNILTIMIIKYYLPSWEQNRKEHKGHT